MLRPWTTGTARSNLSAGGRIRSSSSSLGEQGAAGFRALFDGFPEGAGAALEVGELPKVEGDPRRLRRVLQNLVGNAVKFRGDEPLRVEVSALRDSQEWVVTVRDNGPGVDPDHATRIFGMFSRANVSIEGPGIGLAVCRRIVEAHGGRIWVEAAAGGGSAFRFTMPR